MVDVSRTLDDFGFEIITINTPKVKNPVVIKKAQNGYSSYIIMYTSGQTPKDLSGTYTTPDKALEAFTKFIKIRRETKAARRDRVYEENHGTELKSDS